MSRAFLWLFRALLVSVFAVACFPSEVRTAAAKVSEFHEMYEAGHYQEIYASADEDFKRVTPESDWVTLLAKVRTKLGRIEASDQHGVDVVQVGRTITVTLTYASRFSEGVADEEFTFVVLSGEARLRGYRIASKLLSALAP